MTHHESLPFVQVPHWLMLAPISLEAKGIYAVLAMHVNRENAANRKCWPTRETVAGIAGFSRPQTVDRYLRELATIGAVRIVPGRHPQQPLRKRNFYFVVLATDPAPIDMVSDLALSDYYRRTQQELPGHSGDALARMSVTVDNSDDGADVTDVRNSASPDVRAGASRDVRASALDLYEVDLKEVDEEQEDLSLSRSDLDSLPAKQLEDRKDFPLLDQQGRRTQPARASPCGKADCRDGTYAYNMRGDRRRCFACNPKLREETSP